MNRSAGNYDDSGICRNERMIPGSGREPAQLRIIYGHERASGANRRIDCTMKMQFCIRSWRSVDLTRRFIYNAVIAKGSRELCLTRHQLFRKSGAARLHESSSVWHFCVADMTFDSNW